MKGSLKLTLSIVVFAGLVASPGCRICVMRKPCGTTPTKVEISSAEKKLQQQRLSMLFTTMVSLQMRQAAEEEMWSEEAVQWMAVDCPPPPSRKLVDGCPCGILLCCCPTAAIIEEFGDIMEKIPPESLSCQQTSSNREK